MAAERSKTVDDTLWDIAKRLEQSAARLNVEELALDYIKRLRLELAHLKKDIRLANRDRIKLRKELIVLHGLLNEQVKDLQPRLSGGPKRETKLV